MRLALLTAGLMAAGTLVALPAGPAHAAASVVRDADGVPHIKAASAKDLFYMQGWVHAQDRLFQMDVTRRRASGTLAELLGRGSLAGDQQMRPMGLRRTAEKSLPLLSPQTQDALRAYAAGVNAWTSRNRLPGQYAAVQVSKIPPWTPVDSLVVNKALAFTLSFDLDIDRTTNVQAYDAAGLDGHTAVFGDLFPFAPFAEASPVIDSTAVKTRTTPTGLAADYLERARQAPMITAALDRSGDRGSNSWVIGGEHTATGRPILASDPHLSLETPATFHPITLEGGGFDVQGDSLPGTPFIVLGQNRDITYAATQHFADVTDTYIEKIEKDPASPSGLSTVYQGKREPVVAIEETFRVNPRTPGKLDVLDAEPPGRTLIVPRRNNGPLLSVDDQAGTGLSVQYTGFSPTTELEAFRRLNPARDVDDFGEAIQHFDVGAQHFVYADRKGTIAYFTNAEVPIREDLQAGEVKGNPPYLLRDGTGGNEWLPVTNRQPNQSLPYEILPFSELPKVINPPAGFIVSANNDPTANTFDNDMLNQLRPGGGISYLAFFHNGFRARRITDMVRAAIRKGPVTAADVRAMQADTTALDGQYFTPLVAQALQRARTSKVPSLAELASDKRIVEAAGRLARWRHTYPTGIPQGYDASDRDGKLSTPSQQEIDESVAATIYALWRGRFVVNTLDQHVQRISPKLPVADAQSVIAVRRLLDDFGTRKGVGRSGIDFFAVPGIADPADRRDFLILKSLGDALTLAASDNFKAAYANSTRQSDYRWGKLHRITLTSPLGAPYTIPSDGNRFTSPLPGLPGIPVDGGFNVPDVSSHPVRADAPDRFTISLIPARRFVASATASGWTTVNSMPGGASEQLGGRFEQNLLPRWLTNDTYPLRRFPTAAG
ncbi:penicillin acylase family protein [Actinoplanes aureus]|uniref:Penicillin acylase family protein n=1 Tax=Actinoplanes aureus TaxID=2792083 RepID=A0A931CC10_9ACTN|nr:penicillin acylase family protein [Actinoplanes aureus]MBG0564353.1 penicillin acylase family protein [Actinoplanes aureus]